MTSTAKHIPGSSLAVGDVIDYTPAGWLVARFTELDSPLCADLGPGRIAHRYDDAGMAIYDAYPVRVRVAVEDA